MIFQRTKIVNFVIFIQNNECSNFRKKNETKNY